MGPAMYSAYMLNNRWSRSAWRSVTDQSRRYSPFATRGLELSALKIASSGSKSTR